MRLLKVNLLPRVVVIEASLVVQTVCAFAVRSFLSSLCTMSFSMTRSASWIPLAAVNLILLVFLIVSFGPRSADARPRAQRRDAADSSTVCDFFSGDCKDFCPLY